VNDQGDERSQIARIYNSLSEEARALIVEVLRIENASLHLQLPSGLTDEVLRKVEGVVK